MLRLSSDALWKEIRRLVKPAKRRRAALAYVTKDLVGFKKGDLLVVDASNAAIAAGESSAKLLKSLHKKGVILYSRPGLHAKVLATEDVAIVGSANMSASSESALVEAALVTDSTTAVSQVSAFVEQLAATSRRLNSDHLKALGKIKVKKRGRFLPGVRTKKKRKIELGDNTWLVGVYEVDDTPENERKFAEKKTEEVAAEHDIEADDVSWIRNLSNSKFARQARPGDGLIQIWREKHQDMKPACVLKSVPIFCVERMGKVTFIFTPEAAGKRAEISWSKFKRLTAELGYSRIGINSERIISAEVADEIGRRWHKV